VVFKTISEIDRFSAAIPQIVNVEILSDVKSGVGTRFRETRLMRGKEAAVELEVTEFVENDRIRIVSDAHGTVWDSVFTLRPEGESTVLNLTMDAKAHKFLPKLVNPLMKGMIQKALEADMDAVKAYCEEG